MKRTIVYCSIIIWTLVLIASCGRHRLVVHGFVDEPQDSILFDLKDFVLPASEVDLWNVVKCGGYYYFCFSEQKRGGWGYSPQSFLIALSEDKLNTEYVPLPDGVKAFSFTSVRNDTLVIGLSEDDRYYSFDPKKRDWATYSSYKEHENTLYDDDDWKVKYVDNGEFGYATWFIDKHTKDEFAFLDLKGCIRRIDNTLYVVNQTRVYRLDDPSIGFHCDSTTKYENTKELFDGYFHQRGYSVPDHNFLPVIHFDNEPAEIEEETYGDITYYGGGFSVSEFAKADTSIVGSFVASDTLFCALNTPTGLELAKLDNDHLITIHSFHKDVGEYSRFHNFYEYPNVASVTKYRDESNLPEDKLLILVNDEAGISELFDISCDGNTLLKLCYNARGLNPVEHDGFGELLTFYLKDWDRLTLDSVIRKEKTLGGEISYLNLGADRNHYPPEEIFRKEESYHIDVVSKQIENSYEVTSEYWVQESDQSIPVVFMDWSSLLFDSEFDPEAKHKELAEAITEAVGQDPVIKKTDRKMKYTEWHSGERSIQLYGTDFNVRFLMF